MTSEERLRALVQVFLCAPDTEARHWAADDLAGELVQRIEDHRDTPAELADEIAVAVPWVSRVHLETLLDLADRVDAASGSRAQITELLERRLVLPGIVAPLMSWVRELIGCVAWSRGRQCGARAVGRLRLCRYHRARRRNGDEPTVAEDELFDLGVPWRETDRKRRLAKPAPRPTLRDPRDDHDSDHLGAVRRMGRALGARMAKRAETAMLNILLRP